MDPATPTTIIAHDRIETKAFEQEHIDWPAPESIYKEVVGDNPLQASNSHWALGTLAAALTRLMFYGIRS